MLDVTSSFVLTIDDKPNRNTGTGRELYSCIHGLSQLPRPTLDTVDGSDNCYMPILSASPLYYPSATIAPSALENCLRPSRRSSIHCRRCHMPPLLQCCCCCYIYIYDIFVAMTSFIALCIVRFTQRHIRTDVTCDFNSI